MALSNTIYDDIMHEYELIRYNNDMLHRDRTLEVEEKIPEFREISDKIVTLAFSSARSYIRGNDSSLNGLGSTISQLSKKKKQLLSDNGFPEDYLSPIYRCNICHDTGYVNNARCSCLKSRLAYSKYDQAGIHRVLESENFDNFDFDRYSPEVREDMHKVYDGAREYIENFGKNFRNLLFLGSVGSGKTFMTNCIVKELLDRGHFCLYFSAFSLFDTLSDHIFGGRSNDEKRELQNDLYSCDLLVIDDLGTEVTNTFVRSQFFAILNERAIRQKSAIISSNLSLEKIQADYSERSFSRLLSSSDLYRFNSADIRLKNQEGN